MQFPNGPKLRQEILRASLSESKVAGRLDVSKSTLSRWLSGDVEPSEKAQKAIAKMFPAVAVPWKREQTRPAEPPPRQAEVQPGLAAVQKRECPAEAWWLALAAIAWVSRVSPQVSDAISDFLHELGGAELVIAAGEFDCPEDWAAQVVEGVEPIERTHVLWGPRDLKLPRLVLTGDVKATISAELQCLIDRVNDADEEPPREKPLPQQLIDRASAETLSFLRYLRAYPFGNDPAGFDDSRDPRLQEYDRKRAMMGAA